MIEQIITMRPGRREERTFLDSRIERIRLVITIFIVRKLKASPI